MIGFQNPIGLYGLLILVPFILIYLFKPKPLDKIIPSLMFFLKENKQKKKFSFLRKLLTDIVFFLQLLAIAALALSLAGPYITLTKNAQIGNTVLVIDSSASMQTIKDGTTRFDNAISEAKSRMHGKVSIVLGSLTPTIALENAIQSEALIYLSTLKSKDAPTNIKGAMDLADTLLEKTKGNVIVLSDFITTKENDDPVVSKRMLNARGNYVDFVNLASKASNVGFVDLDVEKDITEAWIKNFDQEEKSITVSLVKNSKAEKKQELKIAPRSKEKIAFETLPGLSTLEITPKDDLAEDNIVYISSPLKETIKVLLISNSVPRSLKSALEAAKYVNVAVAEPPIIPDLNHDIVIVSNVNQDDLLPGTFNDIKKYVQKGGNLIITAQENLSQLDTLNLLPINIRDLGNQTNTIIASQNEITKDIDFGVLKKYFAADLNNGSISLLNSEDNSSLIAYKAYDSGKIFYYGLFDEQADFRFSPDYPIFWNKLIHFLLDTQNIKDYNFKIGEISLVENSGFKDENGKSVAYNFLDEAESDISKDPSEFSKEYSDFVSKNVKEKYDQDLTMILIIAASLLLLAELLYIKFRGDL